MVSLKIRGRFLGTLQDTFEEVDQFQSRECFEGHKKVFQRQDNKVS